MTDGSSWSVEHFTGSAVDFHAREVAEGVGRSVWWFEVTEPTVVLGSTQPDRAVDGARLESSGAQRAHRRSGGGAVWLEPGGSTWVDLVIERQDPLWDDDVSRSSRWVADAWVRCLASLGVEAQAHRGAMVDRPWSRLVCFAGLAPGEVTVGGRKVVGVSQRRTRHSARFQCALLHRWDPAALLDVLDLDPADRERGAVELTEVAIGVPAVSPAAAVQALVSTLPG